MVTTVSKEQQGSLFPFHGGGSGFHVETAGCTGQWTPSDQIQPQSASAKDLGGIAEKRRRPTANMDPIVRIADPANAISSQPGAEAQAGTAPETKSTVDHPRGDVENFSTVTERDRALREENPAALHAITGNRARRADAPKLRSRIHVPPATKSTSSTTSASTQKKAIFDSSATHPARCEELDRLLRRMEVQRITGLSRSSLYRLMASQNFPLAVQLSQNSVAWVASEVRAWILERVEGKRRQIGNVARDLQ